MIGAVFTKPFTGPFGSITGPGSSAIQRKAPGTFDALWTITGAAISTEYSSRTIKLKDIGTGAVITAQTGTTFSINGGEATADAGTISDGDTIKVYLESSSNYSDAVTGGVVIGGVDCDFTIETMVEPATVFDNLTELQFDSLTEEQFDALT